MPTVRKTVRLHRTQQAFCRSAARYRAFIGGRGSGKSWVACYDLIRRARRGHTYMVVGPTYTSLQDSTLRSFLGVARELGALGPGAVKLSAPPAVTLSTGAEILFRSGDDPERLRGPNLAGVVLDEAGLMPQAVYDVMIAALRQGGEPGWLSTAMTPKGLNHWSYLVFGPQPDTGRPRPDTELFHARTRDNPFNPPGFADAVARQYAGRLTLQELDGRFVALEGAEWPPDYFGPGLYFPEWPAGRTVCTIGGDPSKGADAKHGDYAALAVLVRSPEGGLYADCRATRTHTAESFIDALLELCAEWKPDGVALETNQFQYLLVELLRRRCRERGLIPPPVHPVDNRVRKDIRIRRLGPYLARGELKLKGGSAGARLLGEQLRDFPVGEFDDCPDALEMSLRLMIDLFNTRAQRPAPTRLRA